MTFKDRTSAGRMLAKRLQELESDADLVVALPRGGVVLGAVVADELNLPLDVLLVRKLPHAFSEEYAAGAVAEGEEPIYESDVDPTDEQQIQALGAARSVIEERKIRYFKTYQRPKRSNKTILVIDDGIATGMTMKSAVLALKKDNPARIVVAVPVSSEEAVRDLSTVADEVIVLDDPKRFLGAVGSHYQTFDQVTDNEVIELLNKRKGKK